MTRKIAAFLTVPTFSIIEWGLLSIIGNVLVTTHAPWWGWLLAFLAGAIVCHINETIYSKVK